MREAKLVRTETGLRPEGEGWFVLNLAEASWQTTERGGTWSMLEAADRPFGQFGIGVHLLPKGETPGFYHWESDQEGFLVLSGECVAIVEGQERRLKPWDYLHCPPGVAHITVGASAGEPCAILMVGARTKDKLTRYPYDRVAAEHEASVAESPDGPVDSYDAYAQWPVQPRVFRDVVAPWPAPPATA